MTPSSLALVLAALCAAAPGAVAAPAAAPQAASGLPWLKPVSARLEAELVAKHGAGQRARIARGLAQVASLWRAEDGDAGAFEAFARTHFAPEGPALDALFARMEGMTESLNGHFQEMVRDLRWQSELELGPLYPFDDLMGAYSPGAHLLDDLFANKLAFVVLLNFPMSTLEQRQAEGDAWTRRSWAEARLVDAFSKRIPAAVNAAFAEASSEAESYIAGYNLWMHHVLDAKGQRLFPAGKRLLSHWNLRDEIKAQYARGKEGLPAQRVILRAMERIVDQSIPACVLDSPHADWNPFTNEVKPAAVKDSDQPLPAGFRVSPEREADRRYAVLLKDFRAARMADPYSPLAPTHTARKNEEDRQIPEARLKRMLEDVCGSPLVKEVAKEVSTRLGRKLEPFDIWYNGLRATSSLPEAELDTITRKRFPDAAAFKRELPVILKSLGFVPETADWLASRIEVDPARGSGHAMGAAHRKDNARLRTRIGKEGMDYKGFNIAIHELGHNVEQTFSLNRVDHTLLQGVPATAFTESMAYTFQNRDLQVLGVPVKADPKAKALNALGEFWQTFEIAGVSLVDMGLWDWMYRHPEATPAETREAALAIAKDVWNRYYAPVFGQKDCTLLAIYSHIVHSFFYLPDYFVGHLVNLQIEQHIEKNGNMAAEVERMCRIGRLTPDAWMKQATGKPLGPEALLEATREGLKALK